MKSVEITGVIRMGLYFAQKDIDSYIEHVVSKGLLESEIRQTRKYMLESTNRPLPDKEKQVQYVAQMNQVFRALLTEKARQELVQKVRDDDRRRAENPSPSVADNTSRRVRVGNILKQDVTRS